MLNRQGADRALWWLRTTVRRLLVIVGLTAVGAAVAQPQYGGAAPAPSCGIEPPLNCAQPVTWVTGIGSALAPYCANYATSHTAQGGIVFCGQTGSTITQCTLNQPAVPSALSADGSRWTGGSWGVTSIRMAGRDVNPFDPGTGPVYRTWGPNNYSGPTCACQGLSRITPDAGCACPVGMNWDPVLGDCATKPEDPVIITLTGGGTTRALPAGPPVVLEAQVTKGREPVPGNLVTISMGAGGVTGLTDEDGIFRATYIPPVQKPTGVVAHASCSGCSNTSSTAITVLHCDVCEPGFGNPIQAATGAKHQRELDWEDAGPHPLSIRRHYSSHSRTFGILGAKWSLDFHASITISTDKKFAEVIFGNGRVVVFKRPDQESPWFSLEEPADRLSTAGYGDATYYRASDEARFDFVDSRLTSITQRNGWALRLAYDASGALATATNAFGRVLRFAHANGKVTGVTSPDGQQISYGYDSNDRLITVTWPDGKTRRYHYEDTRFPDALTGVTDEAGQRASTFTYDSEGRPITTTHALGADSYSVQYGNIPLHAGSLLAGKPELGPEFFQISANVTDPLGNVQRYTWVGNGGAVLRSSANGPFEGERVASRNHQNGLVVRETDFNGITNEYSWDVARRLRIRSVLAVGRPEQQVTETEWHPQLRLPTRITEAGRTTTRTYDDKGNLTSETIADTGTGQQRTWTWTYQANGLVESYTLPNGSVWRYSYDVGGNRVQDTDPLGRSTARAFDAGGRLSSETLPGGLTTTYSYDARARLIAINQAGETTSLAYTDTGLLQSVSRPDGHVVTYGYDAAQRLIAAQDNRGASITYTLDAAGNRTREEVRDATGAIALLTTRVMNTLNRVAAVRGAAGQTTAYTHDANGVPVAQTDPLNQTTRQTLDALGRPVATTFADNAAATQAWSALDALTQVTDPKGVTTRYTTNAFDEVMSETSPDIGTLSYQRDANGEVTRMEDARGQITHIERDALGRIQRIAYADGQQVLYSYDAAGYLARLEDKSGVSVFTRDAFGRVLTKTQDVNDTPASPSRFKLTYTWHPGGQIATLTYPSGAKVSYDVTAGRVSGIRVWNGKKNQPEVPFLSGLTYTALGQPKAWTWFNGDSTSRSFDTDGRMTANEFASYTYDPAGRITAISQSLTAQGSGTVYLTSLSWQAGYDSRNRLTSFTRAGSESRYTYDANSNRLTGVEQSTSDTDLDGEFDATDRSRITAQAMNVEGASNRLLGFTQTLTTLNNGKTKSVVVTPVTYSVDANGALTGDGLRTFEYDGANRLSRIRAPLDGESAAVSYLTNGLGQRVFRSEPTAEQTLPNQDTLGTDFITWLKKQFGWLFTQAAANTSIGTAYLYSDAGVIPSWALLGEYDNGSATGKGRTEYIWLPTEDGQAIPVGILRNGKLFSIHPDHLGTPRVMKNDANEVVWQWPYSGFGHNKPTGVLKATPNPNQAITNQPVLLKATNPTELNLRFPGQYAEDAGGVVYNYFRNYDPRVGRYTQADPIGLRGGLNGYLYVSATPASRIDPLGLLDIANYLPDGAPIVDIGRSFGGLAAYLQGLVTSNGPLADAGMEALECNRSANMEALAVVLSMGRAGKQTRLRDLVNDPKLGAADRGWLQQEINAINRGQRSNIRNPPGKDLAHERGREAAKGYDYTQANLQALLNFKWVAQREG